jgi:hypothetical protein
VPGMNKRSVHLPDDALVCISWALQACNHIRISRFDPCSAGFLLFVPFSEGDFIRRSHRNGNLHRIIQFPAFIVRNG